MDWVNPHAYIFINTKDDAGAVKEIRFELGPPYALVRGGWKKDTVKIGDKITVEGAALAKDPRNSWAGPCRQLSCSPPMAARSCPRDNVRCNCSPWLISGSSFACGRGRSTHRSHSTLARRQCESGIDAR